MTRPILDGCKIVGLGIVNKTGSPDGRRKSAPSKVNGRNAKTNKMRFLTVLGLATCAFTMSFSVQAQALHWQGYTWTIKSGSGLGPGPNNWNPTNCFVDANGYLHLLITADTNSPNGWDCAELYTTSSLSDLAAER